MKKLYILLLLCIALQATAQHRPAGVMNMYEYGERDGLTVTNLLQSTAAFSPEGILFIQPYNNINSIYTIGNNYTRSFSLQKHAPPSPIYHTQAYSSTHYKIWLDGQILELLGDSVINKVTFEATNYLYRPVYDDYFLMISHNGKYSVGYYNEKNVVTKTLEQLLPHANACGIYKKTGYSYLAALYDDHIDMHELLPNLQLKKVLSASINTKENPIWHIDKTDVDWIFVDISNGYLFNANDTSILKNKLPYKEIDIIKDATNNSFISSIGDYKSIYSYNYGINKLERTGAIKIAGRTVVFITDTVSGNQSTYFCAGDKLYRAFPYIIQYPALFNHNNSGSIFTIAQDIRGRIWAGSYGASAAIISSKDSAIQLTSNKVSFLNGSLSLGDKIYFFDEKSKDGLVQFNLDGTSKIVPSGFPTGFYIYKSQDGKSVYFGTAFKKGLWYTSTASLQKNKPDWRVIDSTKGMWLNNIITITQDTLERVWCGQRGISIYYPDRDTAITWSEKNQEISYGVISTITDKHGTVWLGSMNNGLYYYDTYSNEVKISDLKKLSHPLLNNATISSIRIWGKWLVLGVENKICLLDLDAWHQQRKITLRYVNPQELALTGNIEQNIFLIDKRDSSLWFSTLDNLYQLDMRKWLSLPTYRVQPNLILKSKDKDTTLSTTTTMKVAPTNNSISLNLWFQTKDNMPRYMSTALAIAGDSIQYEAPSLKNNFTFNNLAAGDYIFHVKIFESDGTTSVYQYPIRIKKFLWQQWWFWSVLAAIVLLATIYFLNIRRKKQLAEEQAKTKEAELHSYRAEQEKKIADLKLSSLSSQFRPHFILNALNTIGAQMEKKPDTESVISRLGESVNLIFDHARQNNFAHQFRHEWKLVENVIHIHRLMYLKNLEVQLPSEEVLQTIRSIEVPLGLIQIPIENALLHGLSNRLKSPWILQVEIVKELSFFKVIITDNGVGRKKAGKLSNFTSHGTGLKNLNEIIEIINSNAEQKIKIYFEDDVYEDDDGNKYGTKTIIEIPG